MAAAVHSHGMKLVLDIVANQVGPKSVWVEDPPTPDWFHGTPADHLAATDNFASIASPHAAPPRINLLSMDGFAMSFRT